MISAADIFNARILIVDDQEANTNMLERTLLEAGYTSIITTMDPFEVCNLHRKNHYDLILLDLHMPEMDGFQVMEGLKEIEGNDSLPVIVITAQPAHRLSAMKAGARDFLGKPFDLFDLKTRVNNMLEGRLLQRECENYAHILEQTQENMRKSQELIQKINDLLKKYELDQG